MGGLCLDPVDVEVAPGEQPGTVELDEGVAISKVRELQLALAVSVISVMVVMVSCP